MYEKAKENFITFIKNNFDISYDKIKHQLEHTFFFFYNSEYLCKKLKLNDEQTQIAKLIALLHDFGRFYEARDLKSFRDDLNNLDHASLGVKLLFDEGIINSIVEDRKYDDIIKEAIINHSKYILDTSSMKDDIKLQCMIIRDADKLDSFRAKMENNIYTLANINTSDIENSIVSDNIYNDFMNEKTILSKDRKTGLDIWVSYIAMIFGLYFDESLEFVKEKDYMNSLIDKYHYNSLIANSQMEEIRKKSNDYLVRKVNK